MRPTMTKYRTTLPQVGDARFLADGGIETTLIFQEGLDLPEFAAFILLQDEAGRRALRKYFRTYIELARKHRVGIVLESATWRASPDWGRKLGFSDSELADLNRRAIKLLARLRAEYETPESPIVISGCIGPRGDGYVPSAVMSAAEAQAYHAFQVGVFRQTEADLVTALTMNYVEEAIGITRAAQAAGMPVVISFTVETDGRLPTGESLPEAIERTDAATANGPAYYMINCAHPDHFADVLEGGAWMDRIGGVRANASTKSHAELNESSELDEGIPAEFGQRHRSLLAALKNLRVMGGCCGTDHRHIEAICTACLVAI